MEVSSVATIGFVGIAVSLIVHNVNKKIKRWMRPKEKDGKKLIYYDELPGERTVTGLEDLQELKKNRERLLDWWIDKYREFGKFRRQSVPLVPHFIATVDSETVEYVLKTNFNNYVKGDYFHMIFQEFLGDGIFNVDGATWKKQRITASHLFSVRELKSMVEIFHRHGNTVLEILEKNSQTGSVVDVQDLFQRFTLDSFAEIGFGVPIDSLHKVEPFAEAFDQANYLILGRVFNPLWRFFPFFFKNEKELKKNVSFLNEYIYQIISQRKKDSEENLAQQTDLLSTYLRLKDEDGKPFTDLYLRDIVLNLMLAGRDTTSQLLTWGFYLLSQNPEKEAKLLEEIDSTFNGELPTYETVKQLKYMKAVLDETLRLWPPVPVNSKTALEQDVLPNGIVVEKGMRVGFSLYAMGRMQEYWDCPEEFRPERWFGENGGIPIKASAYIPFNAGPRTCLGKDMSIIEAKVLMVKILQKFTLRLDPKSNVTYLTSVTLKAKSGMNMFAVKRNK